LGWTHRPEGFSAGFSPLISPLAVSNVLRAAYHRRVVFGDFSSKSRHPHQHPLPGDPLTYFHLSVLCLDPLPSWVPDLSLESLPHAPAGRSLFRYPDGDTDYLLYARGEQKEEA
jgi:hypothetical protein